MKSGIVSPEPRIKSYYIEERIVPEQFFFGFDDLETGLEMKRRPVDDIEYQEYDWKGNQYGDVHLARFVLLHGR